MTLEEKVQQMRDHAPAIPRLGVPKYDWWNEGLHGVAFAGYATEFPQVIGMAATWDAPLVHRMGEVISTEARAKYNEAIRQNQREHVLRSDILGAEHQYLSRSALGTRARRPTGKTHF
jgi:beta-glucosidase